MENAGGVIGSNAESDEVKAMRCRFVGRYSWTVSQADCESEQIEISDEEGDLGDKLWEMTNGESFVFATAEAVLTDLLPSVQEGTLLSAGKKDPVVRVLTDRSGSEGGCGGVLFAFPHQEYMFGRLFFDPDGAVIAAAVYTYNSPDYWGQMGVADVPICRCPELPADCRDPIRGIAGVLADLPEDEALAFFDGFSVPLRSAVLRASRPNFVGLLLNQRLSSFVPSIVRELFHQRHLNEMTVPILEALPDDVLQAIRQSETENYETLSAALRAQTALPGFRPLLSLFSLVCSDRPDAVDIARVLLRRGFSIHQSLGSGFHSFNVFEQAAASASPEVLQFLIVNAGASLDTDSLDGRWNALTYAVYELNADNLAVLMEHWPTHPAWTRHYSPHPPSEHEGAQENDGAFQEGELEAGGDDPWGEDAAFSSGTGSAWGDPFDAEDNDNTVQEDESKASEDNPWGDDNAGSSSSGSAWGEDTAFSSSSGSSWGESCAAFESSDGPTTGFGGVGKPRFEKVTLIELASSGNVNKTDPNYIKTMEILSRSSHPTLVESLVEQLAPSEQPLSEKRIL